MTIHFKDVGADHVLQALERLAIPAGYVCSPSVADYEKGRAYKLGGTITGRRSMRCEIPHLGGASIWVEASILFPGEMSIDVFYFNDSLSIFPSPVFDRPNDKWSIALNTTRPNDAL